MKKYFLSVTVLAALFIVLSGSGSVFAQENKTVYEVKQVEALKTVVTKSDIPVNAIGPAMGKAFEKLFGFLASNNLSLAGPPFAVYYSYDPNGNVVFETGVPVNEPVEGNDEIMYKEFPAMKVVSALYTGPYDAMEPFYTEMQNHIVANKMETTGISWEVYLTDPSQVTDPKDNQTMVYFPLK
ncbi:MAG: GyrI-like domain-containing protein [Bacteroidales bacterium]|nr:GyrI-like domain-containing protein [Bacteroidales bacterium]